jgi:hypothetical protein
MFRARDAVCHSALISRNGASLEEPELYFSLRPATLQNVDDAGFTTKQSSDPAVLATPSLFAKNEAMTPPPGPEQRSREALNATCW